MVFRTHVKLSLRTVRRNRDQRRDQQTLFGLVVDLLLVRNRAVLESGQGLWRYRDHREISVADSGPLHAAINFFVIDGLIDYRLYADAFKQTVDKAGVHPIRVYFGRVDALRRAVDDPDSLMRLQIKGVFVDALVADTGTNRQTG